MELRQRSLVDSIALLEQSVQETAGPGPVRVIDYAPGNGTRYVLVITNMHSFGDDTLSLMGRTGERCFMVSWMNGGSGKTMTVGGNDFLHWSYVKQKLGTSESDAVVLAEIIAYLCHLEAVSCEKYEADRKG